MMCRYTKSEKLCLNWYLGQNVRINNIRTLGTVIVVTDGRPTEVALMEGPDVPGADAIDEVSQ